MSKFEIPDLFEVPFDPTGPLRPLPADRRRWSTKYPGDAYICAAPRSFETSHDPVHTSRFVSRPEKVYRLKPQVAEELGLVPHWTVAWEGRRYGLKGAMEFTQPWKWDVS
ncbi:hypothetical protein JAAARDRAFT_39805 [Jaapia argillacea MUCL 33604]|uniref:Uncharacterized protein n=1 Tax=Jaapia argillacea MUCL 33604 TaxID=933084 RepID=A0A067PR83_9AGAM|nr:hypothetical protein JAAARDRAFT_39805 [Jaapia argillacea MUCL 33604]